MLLPYVVQHDARWNRREQNIFQAVDGGIVNAKSTTFKKQPNVPCKDTMLGLLAVIPNFPLHMRSQSAKRTSNRGNPLRRRGCFHATAAGSHCSTAMLLYRLCAIAFPLTFARGDVYDLLTRVRKFFQEGTAETLYCAIKTSAVFSPAVLLLNSSKNGKLCGNSIDNDTAWTLTPCSLLI